MSFQELRNNLTDIELDIVWAHWKRLGVLGTGKESRCSTDPEALLLLTSSLGQQDLRLVRVMQEWLHHYESLVSVERLKTYIKNLKTAGVKNDVFACLQETITRLGIKRLDSVLRLIHFQDSFVPSEEPGDTTRKRIQEHAQIIRKNLQLFLRSERGVNTRADILYYAAVVSNQQKNPFRLMVSAPQMAAALHYSLSSIHRTLLGLEQAEILLVDPSTKIGKSKIYFLNPKYSSKTIGREKCYVDWFWILQLFLALDDLKENLKETDEKSMDESIIKSRLNNFLKLGSHFLDKAYVSLNRLGQDALPRALQHVGMGYLESNVLSLLQSVEDALTSEIW